MKISISRLKDNVHFEPVEITSLSQFVDYATKYNYSTGTFKDNYRNKLNFLEAECIAIDVDNDDDADSYTMQDAKSIFSEYKHIIMPTRSHQLEKNGRTVDRFRVILFLEAPITDAKDFTATWVDLLNFYPAADLACKDASRFYYPSPNAYSVNDTGKLWSVTRYVEPKVATLDKLATLKGRGMVSKATMQFLTYGAPAGKRNQRLFKAAKDMQEQGFTIEECKTKVSFMIQSTGNWGTKYLNNTDVMAINNAYKNIPMYAPRDNEEVRTSAFNFQTIEEMNTSAGNVTWLCDELLGEAGFSMIVGPPKAGKSTLVRQLVKTVCQGGDFLGRKITRGSVLYLTFEEQPAVLKRQFEIVGIKPDDPIMIHTGAVFSELALPDLEDAIQDFSPSLVILDTLFDISQLESINDYKEVKDALSRMRDVARNTGAHILGVHHTNKSGTFLGSQAIFGAVDTMITFIQEGDRRRITSTGKYGNHFRDHEILFTAATQTYSLGKKRERKPIKL